MKHFVSFCTAVIVSVIIIGCNESTTSSGGAADTTKTGANITRAEFPLQATGGDPRGTYAPNTPFLQVFHSNSNFTVTEVAGGSNTGTGMIKMEGATATSGTYTSTNIALNVNYSITLSYQGQSQTFQVTPDLSGITGNTTGTWQVIGSERIIFSSGKAGDTPDTLEYAVTSKGFFFGMSESTDDGDIIVIGAFKK